VHEQVHDEGSVTCKLVVEMLGSRDKSYVLRNRGKIDAMTAKEVIADGDMVVLLSGL